MTTTPDTVQAGLPELSKLPHSFAYIFEWSDGTQKLTSNSRNGVGYTSSYVVYTALQVKDYALAAVRAAQAAQPTRKALSDVVKLTDYDLQEIASIHRIHFYVGGPAYKFAREIEAAHGIGAQE